MIKIDGYDFVNNSKMLFPYFDPSTNFQVKKKTIINSLKKNKCVLARYVSDFDNPKFNSFWYIIKDEFIPIDGFSKNTRNQVKKGIKNCRVEKVTHDYFRNNCYEIYKSSILSYGQNPISKEEFKKTKLDDENRDFWIVFTKESNIPIAYSSNTISKKSANYTYMKYHTEYKYLYPSYALHYEMDKYYLEEKKIKFVNVGARSLLHDTGVQDFLIKKFKYRKAYCKLNIVYTPLFGFIVKMIYPFRGFIKKIKLSKLKNLNAILYQHEIASK